MQNKINFKLEADVINVFNFMEVGNKPCRLLNIF
jgi:hypothetical protein